MPAKPQSNVEPAHPSQSFRDANTSLQLAFIGDLTPNNQPLTLLNALYTLRAMQQQNICLQWFTHSPKKAYLTEIQQSITNLGLTQAVDIVDLDKTAHSINDILNKTDIYTCLSDQRNDGLLYSAQKRVTIVALHTPEQDSSYNQLGLRTQSLNAEHYAATLQQVIINPRLRSALIKAALDTVQPTKTQSQLSVRIEGPYDSSYSLAIVNREFARALHQLEPNRIGLYSTEGGGDFPANPAFLQQDPEIAHIAEQSLTQPEVETCLRLLYPPRVSGMQGIYNGLNLYGWEESYVPSDYIDDFNQHLQFATTMSHYVSRTLRNNGCNIPLFTTGIGVDHILQTEADDSLLPIELQKKQQEKKEKLYLLHISSCFPRKGVDVLLTAYANHFNGEDQICLIIKTFTNPHHDIAQQLQAWREAADNAPDIILINEDLPTGAIRALYQTADVLVTPSRGEGFGLPMAEAMLHDLPVITTGYGGQSDFCTDQTAWLIDYEFRRATSHISGNNSVWVEPYADHLGSLLKDFYQAYQEQNLDTFCQAKVQAARALINTQYRWQHIAQRSQEAIATLPTLPILSPQPKQAIVTSWNSKCGIATYSKLLMQPALADTLVLASKEENVTCEDDANVIRCWQSGGLPGIDNLEGLFSAIMNNTIEQVIIQFNFSFFDLAALKKLLKRLHDRNIQTFLILHSTSDVYWGAERKSLQDLQTQLQQVERILVHSVADLNQLKRFDLIHNVSLFPHGAKQAELFELEADTPQHKMRQTLKDKTVLASYGFLLPHKGIDVLIEAFRCYLQKQPNSHLLLITAEYPADISREHLKVCQQKIIEYQLTEHITFISDFLTDKESQAWLSLADCIIYPYQQTQESSSAAVRWGLALQKPVFCTPLAIFDDVANAVHFLSGTKAEQIAEDIYKGLTNQRVLKGKAEAQIEWLKENDWKRLSHRLKHILSGVFLEKKL
ncbi:glycosyltransferase family 4 protein [Marinomonas sp. 2405UD66-6]|uniref:glycosyltransferase family 4 protein n=1 Tax=Marinomonas sp. 2405UD66-6 TaxID=3391834 RepID=UPI0039C9B2BD